MATNIVYIINKAAHDFSSAERFGRIVYLSKGGVNKYAVNNIFRMFRDSLAESSEDDYILLTSLTVMCVVACCIFVMKHGKLNLLIYKDNSYEARTLDLRELNKEEEQ